MSLRLLTRWKRSIPPSSFPSSSSLSLPFSHIQRRQAHNLDCTGQLLKCNLAIAEELDETIHNYVTWDDLSTEHIKEAYSKDSINPTVIIMAALESQRHGPIEGISISTLFKALNNFQDAGRLSVRESYFSAALLACHEQRYGLAGKLFETALRNNPKDTLALRAAHEAYLAAGWSSHTLGCALRNRGVFYAMPSMLPSVQGIVAGGYLENGRIVEAEEAAKRAIGMSRYRDTYAISALMNSYHFVGKTSEAIAAQADYQSGNDRFGESLWLPGVAMGNIGRGSVNAAFRACLKGLESEKQSATILAQQAVVLWQVMLHVNSQHFFPVDRVANILLNNSSRLSLLPSGVQALVKTIALAAQVIAVKEDQIDQLLVHRKRSDQGERSFMSFLQSSPPHSSAEEQRVAAALMANKSERIAKAEDDLRGWMATFHNPLPSPAIDSSLTALRSVETDLRFINAPKATEETEKEWRACCLAIANFALRDYEQVCSLLGNGYSSNYLGLGLSSWQRDILRETFLEGLLRSDDPTTAAYFLAERAVLCPNDGQTWKRLATVYRQLGYQKEADEADYTSWQLGIGQGGFGGAV